MDFAKITSPIDYKMHLPDFINKMPKAELHIHLEGSISPATLLTLAESNGISLPHNTENQVQSLFNYPEFMNFAQTFLVFVQCLRKPEDFGYAVFQHGAAMAGQNIRYAEITWTPQLYMHLDHSLDDILDGLNEGRLKAKDEWGVEMRWIPDMVRSVPEPMQAIVEWACRPETRRRGVVALGLGGPEKGYPTRLFKDIFSKAHELHLPVNPHAGENEGPESVWQAIHELNANRIGHGIRSVEDESLLEYLQEHKIPLEVCPTSNLRLNVYPSYAAHPLKKLIEEGCTVTLNTDDPVLFQTTLTDEYMHAVEDCGLTTDELKECVLNAVRVSYLENSEKEDMLAAFQDELNNL
jgi:adenosine deaminase